MSVVSAANIANGIKANSRGGDRLPEDRASELERVKGIEPSYSAWEAYDAPPESVEIS
ncbi:hypothetical protein [Novosphingobium sp. Leaf2]|uniref:hypothetical protein n=1 Tax=Novosphingobium sp. Leaf2 TaxID=1735670 RepID=UPI000ACB5E36|nr:hypothetical protein [Novosphingobium sp. Leaf2]